MGESVKKRKFYSLASLYKAFETAETKPERVIVRLLNPTIETPYWRDKTVEALAVSADGSMYFEPITGLSFPDGYEPLVLESIRSAEKIDGRSFHVSVFGRWHIRSYQTKAVKIIRLWPDGRTVSEHKIEDIIGGVPRCK